MRFRQGVLVAVACAIITMAWTGAQEEQLYDDIWDGKFQVEIVTYKDGQYDEIEQAALSYIKRELRGLKDVEIVDYSTDWELHVYIFQPITTTGYVSGTILTIVVTRSMMKMIRRCVTKLDSQNQIEPIWDFNTDAAQLALCLSLNQAYQNIMIESDGPGKLRETCERIITQFDIRYLEPER